MNRRNLKGPGFGLFWVVLIMYGATVLVLLFGLALAGRAQADEPSYIQYRVNVSLDDGSNVVCYAMSDRRTVHCYALEHDGVPEAYNMGGQKFYLMPARIKEM